MNTLMIASGDSQCKLSPEMGGSIISWAINGQNMLRRTDDTAIMASDPLQCASFPLVPFSNRIGHAQFEWAGQVIAITANFAPERHAIHGVGWKRAWHIAAKSDTHCTMTLDHAANADWPWDFHAEQSFCIARDALDITLRITNTDRTTAPIAFGHHPYFDTAGASLKFAAQGMYLSGADSLPTVRAEPTGDFDFGTSARVEGRNVDHYYADWDGRAEIRWENRPYALRIASDMTAAVVYIPENGHVFCFEPVPHINNSLQRPGEQPEILHAAPGETYSAYIHMQAITA